MIERREILQHFTDSAHLPFFENNIVVVDRNVVPFFFASSCFRSHFFEPEDDKKEFSRNSVFIHFL